MVDVLQRFSAPNPGYLIGLVFVFWAVWPIACGVIGATRGQALQGVIHGSLWGPVGLVVVLLSRPKQVCPTCGKRTLCEPGDVETAPGTSLGTTCRANDDCAQTVPVSPECVLDTPSQAARIEVKKPSGSVGVAADAAQREPASMTEEAIRLRAWLEGSPAQ